jgi:tRNA pseudouridine38-40 synthase
MERYKVILAYDGTRYKGFQRQSRSLQDNTIQAVVEAALKKLGWQENRLLAAGRTDTGVHSLGQVIAFDLEWHHPPEKLCAALNAYLPLDVSALHAQPVGQDFHPRYDAISRRYRYRLFCQQVRNPLLERYAWRIWPRVDIGLIQQAASSLVGTHDFAAFGTPPKVGSSTTRTVVSAFWQPEILEGHQTGWVFEISANGFLYRMVRRLVYLQVEIGQDKLDLSIFLDLLKSPPEKPVQGLAAPHGLVLQDVAYPS